MPEPETTDTRVREYCRSQPEGETIYPSDVADALGISWEDAEEVLARLLPKDVPIASATVGRCGVSFGGDYQIAANSYEPGCRLVYALTWYPKGYGPSFDQGCLCVVRPPPDEDWDGVGLSREHAAPFLNAIRKVIEEHMARPLAERQTELDVLAAKWDAEIANEQC
jgi:hypothetical protein